MENSFSEENYLKAIYMLSVERKSWVNTNAIAAKLNSKAPSVSDMLKKLAVKKYLVHEKYQGVKLTPKGKTTALQIVRKHRLWEYFLVEKLHFRWNEVHEIAEQLEHIKSDKLVDELDAFLGFPQFDPHGDFIPNAKGELPQIKVYTLASCDVNKNYMMFGVRKHTHAFLSFLDTQCLAIDTQLCILEKNSFDGSMAVQINNSKSSVFLSAEVVNNILVKQC
jgi:DtxR family Mn-dependent transcriptional regulator